MSNPKSVYSSPSATVPPSAPTPSATTQQKLAPTIVSSSTTTSSITPLSSSPKPNTPVRQSKRPLAKRSCLSCRSKKARCELPDLFVPSSQDPVIKAKRCHRCSALDIDCIVWDGARKRKPKLPPRNENDQPIQDSTNNKPRLETSWSPLTHLASAAETVARESALSSWSTSALSSLQVEPAPPHLTRPSRSSTPLSSLSSLIAHSPHSQTLSPAAASDPFFHIPPEIFTQSSPELHKSSPIGRNTGSKKTRDDDSTPIVQSSLNIQEDERGSVGGEDCRPRNQQSASTSISDNFSKSAEKVLTASQKSHDRTWRSVWRPISVLVDYAAQQPQFASYLARRVFLPSPSFKTIDLMELIDREECLKLTNW